MRAVALDLPDHWRVEWENTPGSHRGETGDGVPHMAPPPVLTDRAFANRPVAYLLDAWADPTGPPAESHASGVGVENRADGSRLLAVDCGLWPLPPGGGPLPTPPAAAPTA